MPAPRLHRLPHRLDYSLIPAPLDLSLPLATEKSALPAIIVTPSSPSSSHDFSIAFLAPPPKLSLAQRFSSFTSFQLPTQLRARTTIFFLLILFILVCHLVTHNWAAHRPHLQFAVQSDQSHTMDTWVDWFNFHSIIGPATSDAHETLQVVDS